MSIEQLLDNSPEQLAKLLNQVLSEQHCTLEQWVEQQALDRETLLRHLERSGFVYIPHRNRIE